MSVTQCLSLRLSVPPTQRTPTGIIKSGVFDAKNLGDWADLQDDAPVLQISGFKSTYTRQSSVLFSVSWNIGEQDRALSFFLTLLIAGWALLVHQTVRFTIVGRLSGGRRCNTWRIGMPKLFRVSNGMF